MERCKICLHLHSQIMTPFSSENGRAKDALSRDCCSFVPFKIESFMSINKSKAKVELCDVCCYLRIQK